MISDLTASKTRVSGFQKNWVPRFRVARIANPIRVILKYCLLFVELHGQRGDAADKLKFLMFSCGKSRNMIRLYGETPEPIDIKFSIKCRKCCNWLSRSAPVPPNVPPSVPHVCMNVSFFRRFLPLLFFSGPQARSQIELMYEKHTNWIKQRGLTLRCAFRVLIIN